MNDNKESKRTSIQPSTFLNPVPVVMVSCRGTEEGYDSNNIVTLAWAGTVCSEPPMLSISIRKSRHSHSQISQSGEFVVNLVTGDMLKSCDFCGVKSGRDTDKFNICNLTAVEAEGLKGSPMIAESPVALSCIVKNVIELGSHDMFIAEIIAVSVDEKLYDKNGKIQINKAGLIAYSHGEYFTLLGPLGFYGYSVAKPDVLKRRMPKAKAIIKHDSKKQSDIKIQSNKKPRKY